MLLSNKVILTVDNSGHPPESQQDEETHRIKGVLVEDEDDVQHEGNHHHQTVKHLKLVLKEFQAEGVQLTSQFHYEECENSQAQVVKHLQDNGCAGISYYMKVLIVSGQIS